MRWLVRTLSTPVLAVPLAAACSPDPRPPTWYADVEPIVEARCASCHVAGGVAPFPLQTYDDVAANATLVQGDVSSGKMPPWPAGPGSLPLHDDPSLTPEQIAAVSDWVDAGMPEGDPADAGTPLPKVGSALSRVDLELPMPESYAPVGSPDDYRCFVLDWPDTEEEFVTGFDVVPGNTGIVHHVAAFMFPPDTIMGPDVFTTLADWDASADGPGYPCFGGPSLTGESLDVPISQIAQWVPGSQGTDFPAGTGIRVKPGSKIVLQVHYYQPQPGDTDLSSLELEVDPTVAHPAAFAPWLDVLWPMGNMNIPAGNSNVSYQALGDPTGLLGLLVGDQMNYAPGFDIQSALLHEHFLGKSATIAVVKANGDRTVLVDVPDYDFNWQITYAFDAFRFEPGDQLDLTCVFDNSAANQPAGREPEDVNWGEGTDQEMCVGNLYISEI